MVAVQNLNPTAHMPNTESALISVDAATGALRIQASLRLQSVADFVPRLSDDIAPIQVT